MRPPPEFGNELLSGRHRWVVTGAAGFVGSHLVEELLRSRQTVVGIDNLSTGRRSNLEWIRQAVGDTRWDAFSFTEGDIRDRQTCRESISGADFVLHQAALGSVPRSMEDPRSTHEVNVDGTLNVFLAALDADARKVVYASSSSVYGDEPTLPKKEDRIGKPLSPYGATKRICEIYAETFAATHGLRAVGLRYFNVVGPRQDPSGAYAAVVPKWVDALTNGRSPVVYGDGETSRDFCPVGNVVQANLAAALSADSTNGRVYNIALGQQTTLLELFSALRSALAANGFDCSSIELHHADFRVGDIHHSLAEIGRAQAELGYKPVVELADALEDLAVSLAQHGIGVSRVFDT